MILGTLFKRYVSHTAAIQNFSRTFWTLDQCQADLEMKFLQENMSEDVNDIEFIIAHAIKRKTLHAVPNTKRLTNGEMREIRRMVDLRLKRMPVQYVIGEWDFREVTLDMRPPVFIPRPETEELVEKVLACPETKSVKTFLEVGPGTGAISLSLLNRLPGVHAVAIDKSREAYELTKANAEKLGLKERLQVINSDFGAGFSLTEDAPRFDMLISNPPYISTFQMENLQPEISLYEDHGALEAGLDGLDVVKDIVRSASMLLNPNSMIWLEVDSSHPEKVKRLCHLDHLQYVNTYKDFNGLPRFCQLLYQPT